MTIFFTLFHTPFSLSLSFKHQNYASLSHSLTYYQFQKKLLSNSVGKKKKMRTYSPYAPSPRVCASVHPSTNSLVPPLLLLLLLPFCVAAITSISTHSSQTTYLIFFPLKSPSRDIFLSLYFSLFCVPKIFATKKITVLFSLPFLDTSHSSSACFANFFANFFFTSFQFSHPISMEIFLSPSSCCCSGLK